MEVSAKYRGAFCEAKVKHVEKCVKCKVCCTVFSLCLYDATEDNVCICSSDSYIV